MYQNKKTAFRIAPESRHKSKYFIYKQIFPLSLVISHCFFLPVHLVPSLQTQKQKYISLLQQIPCKLTAAQRLLYI